MAAERAQGLDVLRYAIDAAFVDETVYTFESTDGRSSICVEFEQIRDPLADTSARRLDRAAEELTRVYDDAQIAAPAPLTTGAGVALAMRARVLGDVEIAAAALDLAGVRVYVTATTEGNATPAFAVAVESIHVLGAAAPTPPPEHRRTAVGIVSLCVPNSWATPSLARYRHGSAVLEIGVGGPPPERSPGTLIPVARGADVVLDAREQEPPVARADVTFQTVVSSYTVRNEAGVPTDAIMIRTADVALAASGRAVGFVVAAALSADWPRLIQAWAPLVASIKVES